MSYLKLSGGKVYDPANGVDGTVADIWVRDGRIVDAPTDAAATIKTLDLSGLVVMPGGVDMHCHIVGPKVNTARKMQPEQVRAAAVARQRTPGTVLHSGSLGSVPSIQTAGYRYTGLGYTTCFDAAISPLAARQTHQELSEVPNVDAGFFVLVGNNHYAMDRISAGDQAGLESFLAWLIAKAGGFAPKLVNPGGVELFKQSVEGNARDLDQPIDGFSGVTPRKIIHSIAAASNELGMPHPVHIHTNNLGLPGNWQTTLETMRTLDGLPAHLAHIQFHSYGGGNVDAGSINSQVKALAAHVNANPNLTVDVGQVMFGRTTSMTGDGPLGHFLQQISGERWYCADTELESGCGVSPIEYKDKNFVHALQWAIGLEWYLLVEDPWQVVMSTDHPNGGNFLAYPQIIRLLMDRSYRAEKLKEVNPKVLERCSLADIDREYTLSEIAIITRSGPARILGLEHKGHLGIGADAEITVYTPSDNYEQMFELPRMVIKAGEILVEDTEIRQTVTGKTLSIDPTYDRDHNAKIETWFNDHYSLQSHHYGVKDGEYSRLTRQSVGDK